MRTGSSAFVRSAAVFMLLLSFVGAFAVSPTPTRAQDAAAAAATATVDAQPAAVETPTAPAAEDPTEVSTDTPEPTETPTSEPPQAQEPTETPTATEAPTDGATVAATDVPTDAATEVPTETPTETAPETATEIVTDTPTPEPTSPATTAATEPPASPSAAATEAEPSPTATPSPSPTATATATATKAAVKAADATRDIAITFTDAAMTPIFDATGGAGIRYLDVDRNFALVYDGDDGSTDGTVHLTGIPVGTFGFTFYKTPSGYNSPNPNRELLTLTADGPTAFSFVLSAATANVTVRIVDGSNQLITDSTLGACIYGLGYTEFACDADDGHLDGVITLQGLPGSNIVTEYRAPDGYAIKRTTPVVIPASGSVSVDVVHDAGVAVTLRSVDEKGALLYGDGFLGACFNVTTASFGIIICDGDDGVQDGLTHFNALPGAMTVDKFSNTGVFLGDHVDFLWDPLAFTLTAPGPDVFDIVYPGPGAIHVTVNDQFGAAVKGACFTASGWNPVSACDADDSRLEGEVTLPGLIDSASIQTDWTLHEDSVPAGYVAGADQTVTVLPGAAAEIAVINQGAETLTVNVVDAANTPVPGASFTLDHAAAGPAAASVVTVSDSDNNGSLQFTGLTPGSYVLTQIVAPAGFTKAAAQTVTITAGGANSVTVTDSATTFSLVVHSLFSGAVNPPITDTDLCYSLVPLAKNGPIHQVDACDSADGPVDGQTHFDNIVGSFADYGNDVHLTSNPAFLENSGRGQVADANGVKNFNFYFGENARITVTRLGRDGHPLVLHNEAATGVCFAETSTDESGSVNLGHTFCDADDGVLDGVASYDSLAPGVQTFAELTSGLPSDEAPVRDFTITLVRG